MKPVFALLTLLSIPPTTLCAETSFGPAGILSKGNREALPDITLSSGQPLSDAPWHLRSGTYYTATFHADGSTDTSLIGPAFFAAIWIDKLETEGMEIRPIGLEQLGFGDEATLEMSFLAVKPGSYLLMVPGSKGASQRLEVTIE
jgi:hypothetical protein